MKSTARPGVVLSSFVHMISSHPRVTWTDVRMGIWELGETEGWAGAMTLICDRTRCGSQAVTGAVHPHLNTSADSARVVATRLQGRSLCIGAAFCVLHVGLKNTQHCHKKNLLHALQLTPQYTRQKTLTK